MSRLDFEYATDQIYIFNDPKYFEIPMFQSLNGVYQYFGLGGFPVTHQPDFITHNSASALQTIDNTSTGIYTIFGAKSIKRDFIYENVRPIVPLDEWGNVKYITKVEDLGDGIITISLYKPLWDKELNKYRPGELTNLEGSDYILFWADVPQIYNLPLKKGDKLNNDFTITRADGSVSYPNGDTILADGSVIDNSGITTKPDGTTIDPNGTITYPDGTMKLPDGTIIAPDGTQTDPDGTIRYPNGVIKYPDGTIFDPNKEEIPWTEINPSEPPKTDITLPDGSIKHPDGSITHPDGSITNADGTIKHTDGTVTNPDGSYVPELDVPNPNGTISHSDGSFSTPDGRNVKKGEKWNADNTITRLNGDIEYKGGTLLKTDGFQYFPNGIKLNAKGRYFYRPTAATSAYYYLDGSSSYSYDKGIDETGRVFAYDEYIISLNYDGTWEANSTISDFQANGALDGSVVYSDNFYRDQTGQLFDSNGAKIPESDKYFYKIKEYMASNFSYPAIYPDGSWDLLESKKAIGRCIINFDNHIKNDGGWQVKKDTYPDPFSNTFPESHYQYYTFGNSSEFVIYEINPKDSLTYNFILKPDGQYYYYNSALTPDENTTALTTEDLNRFALYKTFEEALLGTYSIKYDPASKTFTKVTS